MKNEPEKEGRGVRLEGRTIRAADQVLQVLERHGVDRLFGIPGGTISPLYDALLDTDLEAIVCQHEGMATYLAQGYAIGTQRVGVVTVTSGPGILNTVTGLAAARQDETPLLVLGGEVRGAGAGRGALQDGGPQGLDVVSTLRPVTKMIETLQRPHRVRALVDHAVRTALEPPRGPVFLRLPMDALLEAVPWVHVSTARRAPPTPDVATCRTVASWLAQAERPAILLGLGARRGSVARAARQLAERANCAVITDIEGKGAFPETHPLSLGLFGVGGTEAARDYLAQGVDLLITVGARLDDTTTSSYSELLRPADGLLVQLDHDPQRLCRSYRPDVAMTGDLRGLLTSVAKRLPAPDWKRLAAREAAIEASQATESAKPSAVLGHPPFDPKAVARVLQALLGPDAIFTADIGNHLLFAASNLVVDRHDGFFVSNGLGGMGSGIGVAMGLALAHGRKRPVVGVCGDGGIMMVGNELATCVEHRIPVVLAVFNDGKLGMVEHGMAQVYGRTGGFDAPNADLVALARSLGASAVRVERVSDLEQALAGPREGPLLLDIPIDPSVRAKNPREDVLNFPRGKT